MISISIGCSFSRIVTPFLSFLILLCLTASATAEDIRDFYAEPGLNPFKQTVDDLNESIDPFSGTLQIKHVDVRLPGNGGLDINITRVYTSQQDATGGLPATTPSAYGIGWTMHVGGRVVTSWANLDKVCTQGSVWNVSTKDNPSLELPDGGRELLVAPDTSVFPSLNADDLITRSNWKASCIAGGTSGFLVTSPEGIKYWMDVFEIVQSQTGPQPSWYTSRIEDLHGNWIDISYQNGPSQSPEKLVDSITSSDGRIVTFQYITLPGDLVHLDQIDVGGHRWKYNYTLAVGGTGNHYFLDRVDPPAGPSWQYEYNGAGHAGPGRLSLKTFVNRHGGVTSYSYGTVAFDAANPLETTVVTEKTISGPDVTPATWTYSYAPSSREWIVSNCPECTGYVDVTTETGPVFTTKYSHTGAWVGPVPGGGTIRWYSSDIGQLVLKETFSSDGVLLDKVAMEWGKRQISTEAFWHGREEWRTDPATYAPSLEWSENIRGGSVFRTEYGNYDAFGNPGLIRETTNLTGVPPDRTTSNTHFVSTDLWVVNRKSDEIVHDVELCLEESCMIDFVVDRIFDATTADLLSVSNNGVTTSYTYNAAGDVATVIDANGNVTRYGLYDRGIPLSEDYEDASGAILKTLSRTVDYWGRIDSETNGRGYTTGYTYDDINRVVGIDKPLGADVTIDWAPNARTLKRGGFEQVEQYDGLGQTIRTVNRDLGAGSEITVDRTYDPMGRTLFESYPNSSTGTTYTYDALGRQTAISHPDGSQRLVEYDRDFANQIIETNERGYRTERLLLAYGSADKDPLFSYERREVQDGKADIATLARRNVLGKLLYLFQGETQVDGSLVGRRRDFVYDSRMFLIEEQHPETGATTYTYDNFGNKITSKIGGSGITHYAYDGLNRLTSVDYPQDTADIAYGYDLNDNLTSLDNGHSVWYGDHDQNDNLENETLAYRLPQGGWKPLGVHYAYNALDALSSIQYPSGLVVDYAPNGFGWPTRAGDFASSVTYHPSGRLKSYVLANGQTTTLDINDRLWLDALNVSGGLVGLDYDYDPAGNVTSILDSGGDFYEVSSLSYDKLDRLTATSGPWGTHSVAYDHKGNIEEQSFPGEGFSYLYYYTSNRLSTVWREGPISGPEYSFAYDSYGNATSNGRHAFAYDDASNLVQVSGNGTDKRYFYDGRGQRYKEVDNATGSSRYWFSGDSGLLLYERDTAECRSLDYVYLGNTLIAKRGVVDTDADSDQDGIPDCTETHFALNPYDPSDASGDLDGDGLSNLEEYNLGISMDDPDTDSDGLGDGFEIQNGLDPATPIDRTALTDSDGDFIPDIFESFYGLDPGNSEDALWDVDGDRYSNRQEYLAGKDPTDTSSKPVDGELAWIYQTGGDVRSSAAVGADGVLYAGVRDPYQHVYAFNPDGTFKWKYKLGGYIYNYPSVGVDGTIYAVGSYDQIYAIRPDGTSRWSFKPDGGVISGPVIGSDGTIYVGSYDNYLNAIKSDGTLKWRFQAGGDIAAAPAIGNDGTVYVGSTDYQLYAINPDGTLKWGYQTDEKVLASPAIGADGTIYVGSGDTYFYALNPDGTLKWRYKTGDYVFSSAAIGADGTIYVGSDDGHLYAFNQNGTLKWRNLLGDWVASSPAVAADGTIYVGSSDNSLYAFHPDGTLKWRYATNWWIIASPVIGPDGTVYVGSVDGGVYAIIDGTGGPATSSWPMLAHDERRTSNVLGYASQEPPAVTITAPIEGVVVSEGEAIEFFGSATDPEDGDISDSIQWNSDLDGVLGTGSNISVTLSLGDHMITASVTDSGGAVDQAAIGISVVANALPVVAISEPLDGTVVGESETVLLSATASDAEDGDLTAAIEWNSSLDGVLGVGGDVLTTLGVGMHTLTAGVVDSQGAGDADNRSVTVTADTGVTDSDGDGMPDDWEMLFGLNPNDDANRNTDTDGDGVPDYLEYLGGTDPSERLSVPPQRYSVLNPKHSSFDAQVVGLFDGNLIAFGGQVVDLADGQSATVPKAALTQGALVEGTKPFSIGSAGNATDTLAPWQFAGTRFVIPHDRYEHFYYLLSPESDASVEIEIGSTVETVNLPAGVVVEYAAAGDNSLAGILRADVPILVTHGSANPTNLAFDVFPVPPVAYELYGPNRNSRLGALQDGTTVEVFTSGGQSQTVTLNKGETLKVGIGNRATQGAGDGLRLLADKPIAAISTADGDGTEAVALFEPVFLGTQYGLPVDTQYVVVVCPEPGTQVTLSGSVGAPITETCAGDGIFPGKVYFGSTENGVHIGAATIIESTEPVYLMYEASAKNDEHNLLGGRSPVPVGSFPEITIDTPLDGSQHYTGALVDFHATASDAEDGDLSAFIEWSSDLDGPLGSGADISVILSEGAHGVRARVTDSAGQTISTGVSIEIVKNQAPVVTVTTPAQGAILMLGETIDLIATAFDPEDGDLSLGIEWISSLDGDLGIGGNLPALLGEGVHSLFASVIDNQGAFGGDSRTVTMSMDSTVVDTDGDGMSDVWESLHGLDSADSGDRDSDGDGDGVASYLEHLGGSDPNDSGSTPDTRYYVLNPRIANGPAQVLSLVNANQIMAGTTVLTLDADQLGTIPAVDLDQGVLIEAAGAFSIGGEVNGTDMPAPWQFLGRSFVIPHERNNHFYYLLSPQTDASVSIDSGFGPATLNLVQGEVTTYNAGGANGVAGLIRSDQPILVTHAAAAGSSPSRDVFPVPPAAQDLWGAARGALVGALEGNTTVIAYTSSGQSRVFRLESGEAVDLNVGITGSQGADDVVHLVADKPIAAAAYADGDGTEATAYFEGIDLGRRFGIPVDTQYVTVACPETGTQVTLTDAGIPDVRTCDGDGSYPGKVSFGDTTNGVYIGAGATIDSDKPVYVIYEPSATNDEHNLMGQP